MDNTQENEKYWPKGGFRRIDNTEPNKGQCISPAHNPPSNIVLQPGTWEYTCPACGKTTVINVPNISF